MKVLCIDNQFSQSYKQTVWWRCMNQIPCEMEKYDVEYKKEVNGEMHFKLLQIHNPCMGSEILFKASRFVKTQDE